MTENLTESGSNYSMEDVLWTVVREPFFEADLTVGSQPTMFKSIAVLNVNPLNAEKLDSLFRSIASPSQVEQLTTRGHVVFDYDFKSTKYKRPGTGRFRIEAKAADGHIVSLKCQIAGPRPDHVEHTNSN